MARSPVLTNIRRSTILSVVIVSSLPNRILEHIFNSSVHFIIRVRLIYFVVYNTLENIVPLTQNSFIIHVILSIIVPRDFK